MEKYLIWIHRAFASAAPQDESFRHLAPCHSGSTPNLCVFFSDFPGFSFKMGWFVGTTILKNTNKWWSLKLNAKKQVSNGQRVYCTYIYIHMKNHLSTSGIFPFLKRIVSITTEVIYPFRITKRHGRVLHRWKGTHAQDVVIEVGHQQKLG